MLHSTTRSVSVLASTAVRPSSVGLLLVSRGAIAGIHDRNSGRLVAPFIRPQVAHFASASASSPEPVPKQTTATTGGLPKKQNEQPEISIARMLYHAHRRQPRQAIAIYTQLVATHPTSEQQLLTPADLLVLINAIRQRQASQSDVHALVSILDHLESLAPGSTPVPVLELAVVRAAQCNLPDIVVAQFAKLEQICTPGQMRLPAVAALLNTHRKLGNLDKVHGLAAKHQPTVAPAAPWVFHGIRLDAEAARTDKPEFGLANARLLFAEYVANEPQPAALSKAFARMAMIELDRDHVDQAKHVIAEFETRKLDPTASVCHVQMRLALLANDVDAALGYWRQELKLARKAGQTGLSTELVLQAMLDAGRTDVAVMGVLSEYSAASRVNLGFSRVKYSPYAVVVRHWVKHASLSGGSKAAVVSKLESVWMQIPGTPFLHDYAVEMMCRAWIALGEAERAKSFVQDCEKTGYVPRERTGWSVERVEREVREAKAIVG